LGRHANRARLFDVNGKFLTTIPCAEAEALQGSGAATRTSARGERPLRVRLRDPLIAEMRSNSPTSGCRFPAALTSADMEAGVGITPGELGDPVNHGRIKAARTKIAMWLVVGDHKAVRAAGFDRDERDGVKR